MVLLSLPIKICMHSWNVIKKVMKGNIVVEGRDIYDRLEIKEQVLIYTRIGEKCL